MCHCSQKTSYSLSLALSLSPSLSRPLSLSLSLSKSLTCKALANRARLISWGRGSSFDLLLRKNNPPPPPHLPRARDTRPHMSSCDASHSAPTQRPRHPIPPRHPTADISSLMKISLSLSLSSPSLPASSLRRSRCSRRGQPLTPILSSWHGTRSQSLSLSPSLSRHFQQPGFSA